MRDGGDVEEDMVAAGSSCGNWISGATGRAGWGGASRQAGFRMSEDPSSGTGDDGFEPIVLSIVTVPAFRHIALLGMPRASKP